MKFLRISVLAAAIMSGCCGVLRAQDLKINDLGYFERQGVNVLVFSNDFNGGFNDEKNSGIEIIHHGVRTVQGGAVRLNKTPEQWDLVPKSSKRTVNEKDNSIEVTLTYPDYDFESRVVVQGKGGMETNLQLFAATGDTQSREAFLAQIWQQLDRNVNNNIRVALDAIPYMDDAFRERLRPYVKKYNDYIVGLEKDNPYGVPIGLGNWAGSTQLATFGATVCFAIKYYPDIVDKSQAFKTANWIFGCHPYHNYSLVAAVGAARPKQVFYGNNRADFSAIPGNMAPGLLFRKPDHFENYDDWPFLWGQNEGTIAGNTLYLIFGSAFKALF